MRRDRQKIGGERQQPLGRIGTGSDVSRRIDGITLVVLQQQTAVLAVIAYGSALVTGASGANRHLMSIRM